MLTLKMRLKGCPRCGGDLMPDRSDPAANTYACLQCGRDFSAAAIAMSPTQRLISHATPAPVAA